MCGTSIINFYRFISWAETYKCHMHFAKLELHFTKNRTFLSTHNDTEKQDNILINWW